MPTKTISVDLEAYEALRRRKRRGQSFSDVIKEHFRGDATGETLLSAARDVRVEHETLDAIERIVEGRKKALARSAEL
ncbi:MAG: antitoxin VapB family protein [Thermoanaerobaculia bacterium]|nr:antitoxin VapB family protein [Thermoanaerobaculia bacterium]